jgi:hypothetical protein
MILLSRAYGGYATGTIVELPADTEAALIAQGLATTNAGPPTGGAVTSTYNSGTVSVPIAGTSLVVTCAQCTPSSKVLAYVSQAAADATALRVERIVPAAGSFTIFVTAAATAATSVDWALLPSTGGM